MVGHLYIYGDIGNTGMDNGQGFVELQDVMAQVSKEQRKGVITEWLAHVKSPGGLKTTGDAIYNYLLSLRQDGVIVNTISDGDIGSIATKIFLAGQKRTIVGGHEFFIHNPWLDEVTGEAKDMEQAGKELRDIEDELAKFYSKITGHTTEGILELMNKGTGVRGQLAVDLGFATDHAQAIQTKVFAMLKEAPAKKPKETKTKKAKKMNKYKKFKAMVSDFIKVLEQGEVVNIDLPLQDGSIIRVADAETEEMATGKAAVLVAADGTETPAPAGDHILADGRTVTVDDQSMITAISAPASEMEALKNKIKELESKLKTKEKKDEDIDASELAETLTQMKKAIKKAKKKEAEYLALQTKMREIVTEYKIPESKVFNKSAGKEEEKLSMKDRLLELETKKKQALAAKTK